MVSMTGCGSWDKAAYLDFGVETIRRRDGQKGFEALPRRWVVGRTFGRMTRWRRLVRGYERRIDVVQPPAAAPRVPGSTAVS